MILGSTDVPKSQCAGHGLSVFFGTCVRICIVFFLFRWSSIEVAELDQLDETRVEHNGYSDSIIAKDLDPGFGHNAQIFGGLLELSMRLTVGSLACCFARWKGVADIYVS